MNKELSTPMVVVLVVVLVALVAGLGWYYLNREPKPVGGAASGPAPKQAGGITQPGGATPIQPQ